MLLTAYTILLINDFLKKPAPPENKIDLFLNIL